MARTGRTQNGKFTAGNRAAAKKRRSDKLFYRPRPAGPKPALGRQAYDLPWGYAEDHPEYGLTPQTLVSAWYAAEQGDLRTQVDLITGLVEGDGTARSLFEARRRAVWSKPRVWQADGSVGDSVLAAQILSRATKRLMMTAAVDHQATFNEYGFACTEIIWDYVVLFGREYVVPVELINVPQRRFKLIPETQTLRLLTEKNTTDGEELTPGKWWVTVAPGCNIARSGLGRTLGPYAMYKRWAMRDWVLYSERYGLPVIIVKIPWNANEEVRRAAESIVDNVGRDGGAIVEVPADGVVDVQVVQVSPADSNHTSAQLIEHCNREMTKIVNNSTLSTDVNSGGTGSYAQAEVHADVRFEAIESDAEWLQESAYRAISDPFMRWNMFRPDTEGPCLEIQVERDQGSSILLEQASKMVAMGVDVSVSQLRRRTGLRPPVGNADSLLALIAKAQPTEPAVETEAAPTSTETESEPDYE